MAAAVAGAVGVAALALGVAGGGGCEETGYPDSPDCVAYAYAARTDPSKCDLVTPALLEQITGVRGPGARRACERNVTAAEPPGDVEILERETIGDQVVVELLTDGQEGKLTLEQSGGRWRIASFAE